MEDNVTIPKLMKVTEVAKQLHLAASYIYRLAQEGKLPSARIGRRILFLESDVRGFIYDCRIDPLQTSLKKNNPER